MEHEERGNRGLGTAAKDTVADITRLLRLEGQLLAERLKAEAQRKVMFAGTGVVGVLFLVLGLLFLLGAAAAGLALVLPVWAALLIVGGAAVLLGALLAGLMLAGLRSTARPGPSETVEQIKEDVRWVREQTP